MSSAMTCLLYTSTHGIPYSQWYATHHVTEEELAEQRATVLEVQPKISIVVPTYRTPIPFLRDMIDSVVAQTLSLIHISSMAAAGNMTVSR